MLHETLAVLQQKVESATRKLESATGRETREERKPRSNTTSVGGGSFSKDSRGRFYRALGA